MQKLMLAEVYPLNQAFQYFIKGGEMITLAENSKLFIPIIHHISAWMCMFYGS